MLRHLLLSRSYRLYIRREERWGKEGSGFEFFLRLRQEGRVTFRGERVYVSFLPALLFHDWLGSTYALLRKKVFFQRKSTNLTFFFTFFRFISRYLESNLVRNWRLENSKEVSESERQSSRRRVDWKINFYKISKSRSSNNHGDRHVISRQEKTRLKKIESVSSRIIYRFRRGEASEREREREARDKRGEEEEKKRKERKEGRGKRAREATLHQRFNSWTARGFEFIYFFAGSWPAPKRGRKRDKIKNPLIT